MKILYLVPKDVYEKKMSRVRFQQMEAIDRHLRESTTPENHLNAGVRYWGPGWEQWSEGQDGARNVARRLTWEPGEAPHLVITYQISGLRGCPVPVGTQFNEAFDVSKVRQFVFENDIRFVVFHHLNDIPRYRGWLEEGDGTTLEIDSKGQVRAHRTLAHIPHCADSGVYQDYGLEKDIDVLVAGNMSQYYYPFRNRLSRIATQILRKRGYHVVVLPHPGYTLPPKDGTVVAEEFARMMNRSKLVFTCSMRYNYALAKYSEIALCRSLPVGDLPGERQEFFEKTILRIDPWMLDEEIQRIVEGVLDDPGALAYLTARAYDLTSKTSTMGVYADQFVQAATRFLEGQR